jgi:hypothetical protein
MCFVWSWEETAIISLYSINWLVFITETECVYCAVQTEYFSVIQVVQNVLCHISYNKDTTANVHWIFESNHYLQIFYIFERFRKLLISASLTVRQWQSSLRCCSPYREVTLWYRFYRNGCFGIQIVIESAQNLLLWWTASATYFGHIYPSSGTPASHLNCTANFVSW